jgi:hypothetical protein
MEQRQLRLGDTLDDYCPRERRLTNHAVVAMVGADVKQTRCTTCEAEHEYKHAKVPRQRKKSDTPAALYAQVSAGAPKHSTPLAAGKRGSPDETPDTPLPLAVPGEPESSTPGAVAAAHSGGDAEQASVDGTEFDGDDDGPSDDETDERRDRDEGPVHRQLIRASLPREGQPPASRPIPEFTIRQPAGRPGRFRPRPPQSGGQQFQGPRSNGNGPNGPRSGGQRPNGRPPQGGSPSRPRRNGPGRKRSK